MLCCLQQSGNDNNTVPDSKSTFPGVPELTTPKQEEFLNALRASVEFFVNRMQSNSQRGRSIANDTTVQALFLTLHEMHPQLLQYKQAMEERRAYFEGLQDKITQLRDAREALDALRQEHAARRQLEEQEAARLRQLQMMQKLEVMRQQKRVCYGFLRLLWFFSEPTTTLCYVLMESSCW
ncbi:Hepatocyte growth factor-regulated tyrosine kinase substrate [Clonorchis sinensis]|uniref:Hepatocyte growth factor-regulated tyrosine kinase substrate n=1 Tax=Clonorchis sinensis TaxID=79923 RepID=A0A419QIC7_CLOSI|nr:Hepatocyte growth factor-regulated tyrosine kinase substrate [Clonorchis sinensis]